MKTLERVSKNYYYIIRGLYMRYFYEMYPDAVICPQVEDELITDANMPTIEEIEAELNE